MDLMQPCQITCILGIEGVEAFSPAIFYDVVSPVVDRRDSMLFFPLGNPASIQAIHYLGFLMRVHAGRLGGITIKGSYQK